MPMPSISRILNRQNTPQPKSKLAAWRVIPNKQTLASAARAMAPILFAFTLSGVAHAQGTISFSGAQTFMQTVQTFAIYAGAVICFGGLIFAGIRMMSGRFQFTAPNRELGVANRDLATVGQIKDGQLSVRMDNGKAVTFDANEMRHFDHGYAVTSHSSQGLTADRVLVNIDTTVHPELINSRFAYVSISRAAQDAQLYTDSATSLAPKLSYAVTKSSALSTEQTMAASL
jgi:hypothetical protein